MQCELRGMKFVFFAAFMCVLKGKSIKIPTQIGPEYVRHAEDISDISYSQGETFSSTLPVRVKVIKYKNKWKSGKCAHHSEEH